MNANQKTFALLGVILGELCVVAALAYALLVNHPVVYVVGVLAWIVVCVKILDPILQTWMDKQD